MGPSLLPSQNQNPFFFFGLDRAMATLPTGTAAATAPPGPAAGGAQPPSGKSPLQPTAPGRRPQPTTTAAKPEAAAAKGTDASAKAALVGALGVENGAPDATADAADAMDASGDNAADGPSLFATPEDASALLDQIMQNVPNSAKPGIRDALSGYLGKVMAGIQHAEEQLEQRAGEIADLRTQLTRERMSNAFAPAEIDAMSTSLESMGFTAEEAKSTLADMPTDPVKAMSVVRALLGTMSAADAVQQVLEEARIDEAGATANAELIAMMTGRIPPRGSRRRAADDDSAGAPPTKQQARAANGQFTATSANYGDNMFLKAHPIQSFTGQHKK